MRALMRRVGLIATSISLAGACCLPAYAATRTVANCNDSGPGSLRAAIAAAVSGDTIDLSKLSCPRITLTSGQLEIPQASLTLVGRSRYALTLDGNRESRVLLHSGTGTLQVRHLSLANGYFIAEGGASGGCIRSAGTVDLNCARVHHCVVEATPDPIEGQAATSGGGVVASGDIRLSYSAVFDNVARASGAGGGLRAAGQVTLFRSQVYNNSGLQGGGIGAGRLLATYSLIDGNQGSYGAGAAVVLDARIYKSTISDNHATALPAPLIGDPAAGGGLYSFGSVRIVDSTISGNSAIENAAVRASHDASLYNSTVAFNRDDLVNPHTGRCGGAVSASTLRLVSTIAARNTCTNGLDWDLGAISTIVGAHNLVERSQSPLPSDTIRQNPQLAPLADNGGPMRTHRLISGSPAIDRGSNVLNRQYDQRGPGFARMKGPAPDIGAFER